jgi:radical SAM superfamily enzyme YgiQ (UPF0313 family)
MKKVLLIYANLFMEPLLPVGLSSVATYFDDAGYDVKLFDSTLYKRKISGQSVREKTSQVKPVNWNSIGLLIKEESLIDDYLKLLNDFNPDLVGISTIENTYKITKEIIERTPKNYNVLVGGVFASFGKDFLNNVNVFIGEFAPHNIEDFSSNSKRLNINELPITRFNYFDDSRIYRPMSGKLYRMLPIEFSRGCPFKCSYCSAPVYEEKFPGWYRYKSIDRIEEEIIYYIKNYNIEYFYFISETFLAMPDDKKEKFYNMYSKYKIPFWFNTRPETIKRKDIEKIAKIGCHRISMGVEHGNYNFRRSILNRNYTNALVINAAKIIKDNGIELSINNMVGFPDETPELAMDTVELNKKIIADSHTLSIFQPYKGTRLHDYCVRKKYWSANKLCEEDFYSPSLDMNYFPKEKIMEFYYNFNDWIK